MNDTVHLACCFDRGMELPFLVLTNSIKRHLKGDRKVVLHAFHSDPLAHEPTFLHELNSLFFEVRCQLVRNQYGGLAVKNFNTAATLMRLMLPALLDNLERVLYLDCDTVVLKDISPLYDTDLSGHSLAGVLDYALVGIYPKNGMRFGLAPDDWPVPEYLTQIVQLTDWKNYFNAGVLVMDLEHFRQKGLIAASEDFLEKTNGKRLLNDQDALNHVVDGSFVHLDPRWNVQASRVKSDFKGADNELEHVADLWWSDPWIIHYCGSGKPWRADAPNTVWDQHFWNEILECKALPLLIENYLATCQVCGHANLASPESLLAEGKPALERNQILQHARKFAHVPEISLACSRVTALLDRDIDTNKPLTTLVPVKCFKHIGGTIDGNSLAFDLNKTSGHIVYGPYLPYPQGNYEAVFDISLTLPVIGGQCHLVIEVTDDSFNFLAQRFLSMTESITESSCALSFVVTGEELFLEFRIFVDAFESGSLSFSGVKLKRRD